MYKLSYFLNCLFTNLLTHVIISEVCLTFAGSIARCIPAVLARGTGGSGKRCVPRACRAVRRTR